MRFKFILIQNYIIIVRAVLHKIYSKSFDCSEYVALSCVNVQAFPSLILRPDY